MSEQAGLTAQGLSDLYAVSRKNGTEIEFGELAVKWAALADAEIERLRAQLAAQQSAEPVSVPEGWMRDIDQVEGLASHLEHIGWIADAHGDAQCNDQGAAMAAEVIRKVLQPLLVVAQTLKLNAQPVAAIDRLAEFAKFYPFNPAHYAYRKDCNRYDFIDSSVASERMWDFLRDMNHAWLAFQAGAKLTTQQELKK